MPLCYHISENFSGVITTKKGQLKGGIFLILAAVIWGLSFVAQSEGLEVIGTLTFNGIRMIMGGTVLLPVIAIMSGVQKSKNKKASVPGEGERTEAFFNRIKQVAKRIANIRFD